MITISTLLYQGNYIDLFKEDSWFLNYSPKFDHKKLILVNNVNDRDYIEYRLSEIKEKHKIEFSFMEDVEKDCIKDFKLDINRESTLGYYYIIPYFALLKKVDTEFVFHISEDCTKTINFDEDFVLSSIEELKSNKKLISTTINWGTPASSMGYDTGEWEQISSFKFKNKKEKTNDKFWYSFGFSDQVFIAEIKSLKSVDYNLQTRENPICFGTPYCPDSWERRVSEYMYQNDLYRGVWKNNKNYYIHGK